MINAKIKLVLKEVPDSIRDVGDLVWIPLQNQPSGLPPGLTLEAAPLDLVVPKKMWSTAQKKLAELKAQGQVVYQIIEAAIGIQQNRLAAVAISVQVIEGKTK